MNGGAGKNDAVVQCGLTNDLLQTAELKAVQDDCMEDAVHLSAEPQNACRSELVSNATLPIDQSGSIPKIGDA